MTMNFTSSILLEKERFQMLVACFLIGSIGRNSHFLFQAHKHRSHERSSSFFQTFSMFLSFVPADEGSETLPRSQNWRQLGVLSMVDCSNGRCFNE